MRPELLLALRQLAADARGRRRCPCRRQAGAALPTRAVRAATDRAEQLEQDRRTRARRTDDEQRRDDRFPRDGRCGHQVACSRSQVCRMRSTSPRVMTRPTSAAPLVADRVRGAGGTSPPNRATSAAPRSSRPVAARRRPASRRRRGPTMPRRVAVVSPNRFMRRTHRDGSVPSPRAVTWRGASGARGRDEREGRGRCECRARHGTRRAPSYAVHRRRDDAAVRRSPSSIDAGCR